MKANLTLVFATLLSLALSAQNAPINFEEGGNGADWVWTTFENDSNPALEIIDNPDASGINTSATVAKFTALQAGQPFAGFESLIGAGIGPFYIDASNSTIQIMVWKSVISDVGIKLVRNDFFSLGEIKIPNTKTNEWELIEFDFSSHIGNTYHQIVVFPDFNARQSDNVIYIDNLYGDGVVSTTNFAPDSALEVFPNPATNFIKVKSVTAIDGYEIYSITGELIATKKGIVTGRIDISTLAKGAYLLKTLVDDQVAVEKFIKE